MVQNIRNPFFGEKEVSAVLTGFWQNTNIQLNVSFGHNSI